MKSIRSSWARAAVWATTALVLVGTGFGCTSSGAKPVKPVAYDPILIRDPFAAADAEGKDKYLQVRGGTLQRKKTTTLEEMTTYDGQNGGTTVANKPVLTKVVTKGPAAKVDCGPNCAPKGNTKVAWHEKNSRDVTEERNDHEHYTQTVSRTTTEVTERDVAQGVAVIGLQDKPGVLKNGTTVLLGEVGSTGAPEDFDMKNKTVVRDRSTFGQVLDRVSLKLGASVKWMPGYEADKTYNTLNSSPTQTTNPTQTTDVDANANNKGITQETTVNEGDTSVPVTVNEGDTNVPVTVNEGDTIVPVTVEGDEGDKTVVAVKDGDTTLTQQTDVVQEDGDVTQETKTGDTSLQVEDGGTQVITPVNVESGPGDLNDCDTNKNLLLNDKFTPSQDPLDAMDSEMVAKVRKPMRPVAHISMDKSGHIKKVVVTAEYKVA